VVLTLVETKRIRINIHKRNNTKNTVHTIRNTACTNTHIAKHLHITKPKILYDSHLHHRHFCNVFLFTFIPFAFHLHVSLRWYWAVNAGQPNNSHIQSPQIFIFLSTGPWRCFMYLFNVNCNVSLCIVSSLVYSCTHFKSRLQQGFFQFNFWYLLDICFTVVSFSPSQVAPYLTWATESPTNRVGSGLVVAQEKSHIHLLLYTGVYFVIPSRMKNGYYNLGHIG